ncbi:MAG: carbohydrate kinase family protein [Bryobacteraceae bacterium]
MPISTVAGVICCGNISLDIPVWPVDRFQWGTTLWVDKIEETVGGNGGSTAYTLAKLGAPVRLLGVVGRDAPGDKILAKLEETGVDVSRVGRSDLPTNSSICVVHPTGDRLFFHQRGASSAVSPDMLDFTPQNNAGFSHFHLANLYTVPAIRASAPDVLRRARANGLTTSLDTGWDADGRWMQDLRPCLPLVDLLFVNETEGKMLTGEDEPRRVAEALRDLGATDILVKLGGKGCVIFAGGEELEAPGFAVKAIDTTGAGDCFGGGFLAALHHGKNRKEAARFANAVGALKVSQLGAVKGVRNFADTELWMAAGTTL